MKKIIIGIDISKEKFDASAIDVRNSQLGVLKLDYHLHQDLLSHFPGFLFCGSRMLTIDGRGTLLDVVDLFFNVLIGSTGLTAGKQQ